MSWKVFKMGHMSYFHCVLVIFANLFSPVSYIRVWVSESFCRGYLVPPFSTGLSACVVVTHQLLSHDFSPVPGTPNLWSLCFSFCPQAQDTGTLPQVAFYLPSGKEPSRWFSQVFHFSYACRNINVIILMWIKFEFTKGLWKIMWKLWAYNYLTSGFQPMSITH